MFTDVDVTLEDIQNGINLYNARLIAFQRTNVIGEKFNNDNVRNYILTKLKNQNIPFEIMPDTKLVDGYPSKCDLWSTRNASVLLDAIDCTGNGNAYYFKNENFRYEITFNQSNIPIFLYSHLGAIVLKGENNIAISRLLCNDKNLLNSLNEIIGSERLYSYLEGRTLFGTTISNLEDSIKKI